MGDEIVYSERGRTYTVRGVGAKATSVFGASQELDIMIEGRVTAATNGPAAHSQYWDDGNPARDRWRASSPATTTG